MDITMENLSNPKGVGIIVVHNDKILLGKRKDSDQWSLAGGGIDPGEEPIEAAERELFEEFGLQPGNLKYYGVTPSNPNPFKRKDSTVGCSIEYYAYLGYSFKDIQIKLEPTEFTDYKWATEEEALSEKNMYPNSKESIRLFLRVRCDG